MASSFWNSCANHSDAWQQLNNSSRKSDWHLDGAEHNDLNTQPLLSAARGRWCEGGVYLTCIIMIDITNKTCWWSHLYKCINQSYFSFSLQYIINLNIINYYIIQFDIRISLVKHFKNKNMKQYIDSKKMEKGQTHSNRLPLKSIFSPVHLCMKSRMQRGKGCCRCPVR